MREFRQVVVIGAGTMGHGVAQIFAQGGFQVALYDSDPGTLKNAMRRISRNLDAMVHHDLLTRDQADEAYRMIHPADTVRDAAQNADFVTECVVENLSVKQALFQELEACASTEAILASNTSTLLLAEIAQNVRHKNRLVITHYFNPTHIVPVVEIVPGPFTDSEVVVSTKALLSRIGKRPIVLNKEIAGFLVNRVQAAMAREVLFLLGEGLASAQDIDEAIRGTIGFRLAVSGPLETMDFGGLDIWLEVVRNLMPEPESLTRGVRILSEMVSRSEIGVKGGRGFYDWEAERNRDATSGRTSAREEDLLRLLKQLP